MMKSIVIALGGNALLSPSGKQSLSRENKNIDRVSRSIAEFYKNTRSNIVITHGNGSQVGDELMRNEHAKKYIPKMPLYLLNAETQALIGTVIETSLRNSLNSLKISKEVCVILAHALIDENDPAFKKPSKQIGPFYTEKELYDELKLSKFSYIKSSQGYRMVVASPRPKEVLEVEAIIAEVNKNIVITCGGGGIPTIKRHGALSCIDAVIDKDLTTQLLATSIGADTMIILTNVDYIYENYEKQTGKLKEIRASELKKRLRKFEEGTIRPKIEACIRFIESGGKQAFVGDVFKLDLILKGKSGTKIY